MPETLEKVDDIEQAVVRLESLSYAKSENEPERVEDLTAEYVTRPLEDGYDAQYVQDYTAAQESMYEEPR